MAKIYVPLDIDSRFIFSTSGSPASIKRHNDALQALGVDLVYFTIKDPVSPEIYTGLIKNPFVRGGVVTAQKGLKSSVIPFLDEIEPIALKTRAVNTILNRNGKLSGYNTDAYGFEQAVSKGLKESGIEIKTAAIYGNGGVSGVAFHVLREMGIKVMMTGRNAQKVEAKKKELGIENTTPFEGPCDLLVDATPISSYPDFLSAPQFEGLLKDCKIVFCHSMPEKDHKINYLEEYCLREKIFFIPGSSMYAAQLVKQYKIFLNGYLKNGKTPITEKEIEKTWNI